MSEAMTIPEKLHFCPRCGDLASGTTLCEDCIALEEIGRKLDEGLRIELQGFRRGARDVWVWRVRVAMTLLGLLALCVCGAFYFAGVRH